MMYGIPTSKEMAFISIYYRMVVQHLLSYLTTDNPLSGTLWILSPLITEGILPDKVAQEAKDVMQARLTTLQNIKSNMQIAQERMKNFADTKRTERELAVGDMAYLKIQPYRHNSLGVHKELKLHSKYYGPFKVLQRIGQVAYKLLLLDDCSIHPVFHVSQLKKHIRDTVIQQRNLPLTDADGNIHMKPNTMLQRRLIPQNNEQVVQWLIKWVNLPETAAMWEDADYIRKLFPDFTP
jgi:hypothetical protein